MATKRNKSRRPVIRDETPSLTPLQRALLKEGDRKVNVRADGQKQLVSIYELIARKLLQVAANGSVHALSNAFNELVVAERLRNSEIETNVAIGHAIKEQKQRLLDKVLTQGGNPDRVLPHPDDVIVVEGEGYKIAGPVDEAELAKLKETCRLRDQLLLQDALDRRLSDQSEDGDPLDGPGTAFLFADLLNRTVPERHRLSDTTIIVRSMRHDAMPKRQLLKEVHRGWRALGRYVPRGKVLPPLRVGKAHAEIVVGLLNRTPRRTIGCRRQQR